MKSRNPAAAPRLYRPAARVAFLRFVASHKWSAAAVAVALPVALVFAGSSGCSGEDETETEAPAIASAAPAPPAATVEPAEDAADAPQPQASASSKPKAAAVDPTGLQACCHSLRSNAATAPDDQKDMMLAAAAVCESAVRSPETRPGLIAVRTALKGAKLPAECK